jgi:hypothetical protein
MKTSITPPLDLSPLLDVLAHELDLYRLDSQSGAGLRSAALAVARALGSVVKLDPTDPLAERVCELSRGLWGAGYLGQPVPASDLALAGELRATGWPGLLGAMIFAPCWQWTSAPTLEEVPEYYWAHFVDWVFVAPCLATGAGAADSHLAKLECLAEDVNRWAGRNIAAACVKSAVEAFERNRAEYSPLRSTRPLHRWTAAAFGVFAKSIRYRHERDPITAPEPRAGRALRVGVLLPEWGESISARALLPRLAALDPSAFSLHLYAERNQSDALETIFRGFATGFQRLPSRPLDRVPFLRADNLDVLVFGGRMGTRGELVVALHRIAALQVVTEECVALTGLPEIDLRLSCVAAAPAEFSESLGLLPSPGFAWDGESALPAFEPVTRTDLGLPADGPVYVSAPALEQLSPETLQAWAALLLADSAASLLLLLPTGSDTFALEQILNRLTAATGLDSNRIVVSVGDLRASLSRGDVYLDTYPCSAPLSLLAALAAGLPAVAWEGSAHRSRLGAHTLRALGQAEWAADSAAGYVERAQRLMGDATLRTRVREQLTQAIDRERGLGDPPYASRCFGELIARAFDLVVERRALPATLSLPIADLHPSDLAARAEAALKRADAPAAVAYAADLLRAEPHSALARALLGRAHLLAGQPGPALACFFSALRGRENDAQAWLDVGAGLRARREIGPAISAYETGLRLNPRLIEGWIAIAELARASGVNDLAEDAIGVARRIDASDARLAAFNS